MKALTIWQPWASLLACGGKRFETRSWATSYRGPIAIHAAAIKIPQVFKKCFPMSEWTYHPDHDAEKLFLDALAKAFEDYAPIGDIMEYLEELPTGAVIATANLIGCHEIDKIQETGCWDCNRRGTWIDATPQEEMFGNWTPGRYAWEFSDMKIIAPVPVPGRQGLWEWGGGGLG